MRHLKRFENINNDDFYYKVDRTYHFDVVMDMLNFSDVNIYSFTDFNDLDYYSDGKIAYIAYEKHNDRWSWGEFDSFTEDFYKKNNYEYKGEIKPTIEDIENFKLKKDTKKYNL